MSCGCGKATFRLLDAYVGWDAARSDHLQGFDDPAGICLATVSPGAVDPGAVLGHIPPSTLALGCLACGWYLLTLSKACRARVLFLDQCSGEWKRLWAHGCSPPPFENPVAIAVWENKVAVADRAASTVYVWAKRGQRLVSEIHVKDPGPIALSPCGDLYVASGDRILRFGPGGWRRPSLLFPSVSHGAIDRIAADGKCGMWVVTQETGGLGLWHAAKNHKHLSPATLDRLQKAIPVSSLAAASELGFCLAERDAQGFPVSRCFTWCGEPLPQGVVIANASLARETTGNLWTVPLDSGIPRCRWHRVQLDADVPAGSAVSVSVVTTEDPNASPHPLDWTQGPNGAVDFLIDQPPGRYLLVHIELTGNGVVTPQIRRVRLDFPRVTGLDRLPAIYRENPEAEDFSERFLSLFDASIAELDRAIERYPALLNAKYAPDAVLPWLGRFFDIAMDPAWEPDRRRKILQAAPLLYRKRGTVDGMKTAIGLIFDFDPSQIGIEELASGRAWGSVGQDARVGSVRLFGKAKARFRLGASSLGAAPLRSFGNPDQDPLCAEAFRFRVSTPPFGASANSAQQRLAALVEAQKPAGTMAMLRSGGNGFVVGPWSAIGVDTVLAAPPPVVLGSVRLGRVAVLRPGAECSEAGLAAGRWTVGASQFVRE